MMGMIDEPQIMKRCLTTSVTGIMKVIRKRCEYTLNTAGNLFTILNR